MQVRIIGAGGVGFYVSLSLSRAGVEHVIYDVDDLQGGLGYSRMPKASPTTKKTALLRGVTVAVFGDRPPTIVDAKFTGAECEAGDLVVDCSDMALGDLRTPTSRKSIWKRVRETGARIIRVSYDGQNNTVVVAEGLPLKSAESVEGSGYSNVPSLGLSFIAGGVGAIAVQKILHGHEAHIEFQITLSDYFPEPVTVVEEHEIVEAPVRRRRRAVHV